MTKAKFTPKKQEPDITHLRTLLPEQCNNDVYPVVLLKNIYDASTDSTDEFMDDLKVLKLEYIV